MVACRFREESQTSHNLYYVKYAFRMLMGGPEETQKRLFPNAHCLGLPAQPRAFYDDATKPAVSSLLMV
jgi:hypothetical protein